MLIECPRCDAKVDAKVLASRRYHGEDEPPSETSFLECPACQGCIVAEREQLGPIEFSPAIRLWPEASPSGSFNFFIPDLTRLSIEQAQKCFNASAYDACAVMCRRAIEAICAEHKTKSKNLVGGLKELRDKKVIDERLFEWGDALRQQGNIGAHASEESISREDARNVLEFARAICEYVFVLTAKYEQYQARQKAKAKSKTQLPTRQPPVAST
jgi:hypothetical protein